TRFSRDWSSDVCSSDLPPVSDVAAGGGIYARQALARAWGPRRRTEADHLSPAPRGEDFHGLSGIRFADRGSDLRGQRRPDAGGEIGRASCRERGWKWGR